MISNSILLTGVGGALGAVVRGYLGKLLWGKFPWATLFVNVLGSYMVGAMVALFSSPNSTLDGKFELLALGFCGGFTTFSAFSYQTMQLFREKREFIAILNIFFSVFLSILAAFLGILSI